MGGSKLLKSRTKFILKHTTPRLFFSNIDIITTPSIPNETQFWKSVIITLHNT